MIVKFIVGWFLGIVFYGWQLSKTGKAIRQNETARDKGIQKEVFFISSNLIIVLITYFVINCLL